MKSIENLLDIMARLRDPKGGCPWDVEQTFATIAPYTIEEAYEVADAIERNDLRALRDELGDLLLQVVFHAQMAAESGAFDFDAVATAICDKLVRRHPHVFARRPDHDGITSGQVLERWESIKAREREAAGRPPKKRTTLSGIPRTLPALIRAYEISARAATVGFDWQQADDVLDKIEEEVAEVRREVESGGTGDLSRAEEEMGDLLFAIANLSRKLGIEPEAALRRANEKFTTRFDALEHAFAARQMALSDATLDEMEAEWQRIKKGS